MSDILSQLSTRIAALAEAAGPSLASIPLHHRMTASAFHWRDGYYVAAEEIVGHDDEIALTLASGETVKAELAGRDASTGIALLKTGRIGIPTLAAAAPVKVGNLVVVAGHSGESPLATLGTVAEVGPAWRSRRGGAIDRRIGLSAAIGARFEGGVALDPAGGLVGMVLFGPRRRVLVIPAETIERVAPTLVEKGYVARGYLGASLQPVKHPGGVGAMIMSLDDNGPAKQAGLHQGDIVTAWNGEAIEGVRDLMRRLDPQSVGTTVTLGILRGGAEHAMPLTVGARPRG